MHVGILRTDSVRPEWVPTFGEYPDMFERLLSAEDPTLSFTTWNAEAGDLPDSVEAADGFLITGSKSSVYDDKDWIRALEGFVRECHAARRKGERLEPSEQQALLDALDAIPWAPTCPHGRPVAIPFELAEIERRFRRR